MYFSAAEPQKKNAYWDLVNQLRQSGYQGVSFDAKDKTITANGKIYPVNVKWLNGAQPKLCFLSVKIN